MHPLNKFLKVYKPLKNVLVITLLPQIRTSRLLLMGLCQNVLTLLYEKPSRAPHTWMEDH